MSNILAKKIYQNGHYVDMTGPMSSFTSEQINGTPTTAWLVLNPYGSFGDAQWQLEFKQPKSMINVVVGVWIQWGSDAALIDGNVDDVVAKINGCCGNSAQVTQNYASGLPAYQAPVQKTYTITRSDDGTVSSLIAAEFDYMGDDKFPSVPNSFSRSAFSTGVSTYVFQAYRDPKPVGTDTIARTAIVFSSNDHPTLSGSNVYNAIGTGDGVNYHIKSTATFSALATALNADAVLSLWGTWAVVSNHITLTSTNKDLVTIVLGQEAP